MRKDLLNSSLNSSSASSFSSNYHRSSRTSSSSSSSFSSSSSKSNRTNSISSNSSSISSNSSASNSSMLLSSSMSSISSSHGRHRHKTKPKSFKKYRYSLSRSSRQSINRLGSIQEENEAEHEHEKKQLQLQLQLKEQRVNDPQDSIEYIQAIKAIRAHLNDPRFQSQQHQHQHSNKFVSVINETVKTLEATLILNQFSKSCHMNRYEQMPTSTVLNKNTNSEKGAKYTLTRVIKKVTIHPNNKSNNENSSPSSQGKRIELMYIWGRNGNENSNPAGLNSNTDALIGKAQLE